MVKRMEIDNCILYCGDAMEILPDLDPVDCIVTDPPYALTSGGGNPKSGRRMSGKFNNKNYNNNGNIVDCDITWADFMPLLYDALESGHAYIMCNNRHIANCENAAINAGFGLHNWLVWDKGNATPNRWYMKNCEFTGFFYKQPVKYITDCGDKQLISCPQEPYGNHPTPKPVALMQHYIKNSTQVEQTVLDPFMGVGSTGVAALRLGRKFIGIEKDERYYDTACERILKSLDQGSLF